MKGLPHQTIHALRQRSLTETMLRRGRTTASIARATGLSPDAVEAIRRQIHSPRTCRACAAPIGPDQWRRAVYCSDDCRPADLARRNAQAARRRGPGRPPTDPEPTTPGMSVEQWLAERRPAWARERGVIDAWAGYSADAAEVSA